MAGATTKASEHELITSVVQHYIDGGRSGRGDEMKQAFHEDATIFGYIDGELFAGPIQKLLDWVDGSDPATGLQGKIVGIDVAGTIATVRLELDNWLGHRFTDQFTLLKVDGSWKIMNKVFHTHT